MSFAGPGATRGEVVEQRLRRRRADHAQHRDQRQQHREQREHAEIGQRGGPRRQLVLAELLEGALEDRRPGLLREVGRLVGDRRASKCLRRGSARRATRSSGHTACATRAGRGTRRHSRLASATEVRTPSAWLYRAALMQRRTKIVATIGPASRDPEVLARMVEAGMDVARLNFSHGSADEHAETARLVRDAAGRAGRQVAILQDLPGPKLRIGKLRDGVVEFKPGDRTTFVCGPDGGEGDASRLFITYAGLASTVERDEIMYLADGAVRLRDHRGAPGRRRDRRGGRDRRRGRLAPGPEHPGRDRGAARGARGGPRARAHRRADRRRHRRAVVRAPRRGRHRAAQAHAAAAGGQDREAAGGHARRGDRARRRLRDGRARRPRHRDADRGGADRPEADHLARRRARPAGRSPRPRCSTRWSPPRARRAPRSPTSPTRSSTAPTR